LEHFRKARQAGADPADQASLRRPRVGFFGVIDERMDLELLRDTAELCPEFEFVVLGPVVKIEESSLPRRPNVHWLGCKKYEELPSYIGGWDVAMMPFARNDATKFISPTKTLEYLAAGKSIVSTSIRDVVRPYGEQGLVRIADTPADFAAALRAALNDPVESSAREAVLACTSWDSTFDRMRQLIAALPNASVARTAASAHDGAGVLAGSGARVS
jgi:UDP-galactopyranose mutase